MTDDELAAVITALALIRARAGATPPIAPESRWALAARLRTTVAAPLPIGEPGPSRWTLSGRLRG